MEIKDIAHNIACYYDFSCEIEEFLKTKENMQDNLSTAYFSCFNAFITSFKNYLLLVYDDITKSTGAFYPKTNTNKIFIRNMVEAILILEIFRSNPALVDKYLRVYESDLTRINHLYSGDGENKKYLKRFGWLPKLNGRKPSSLTDILEYINFESSDQKEFCQILIKNLDNFIHPSFHIGKSIENNTLSDINNVVSLFAKEGITHEIITKFLLELNLLYKDEMPYKKLINLVECKDKPSKKIHEDFIKIKQSIPTEVSHICYSIVRVTTYLTRIPLSTYRQQNLRYLLADLGIRYEDLLKAFYTGNSVLFGIQSRSVLESLSMIHTLMKEDERRAYIFNIHQQIKGYEANKIAIQLLQSIGFKLDHNALIEDHQSNIEIIRNYYQNHFNLEVSEKNIKRLFGWAIQLHHHKNENVPNTAFILDNLLKDCFDENNQKFYSAFFEESNAFTHVTTYGYNNQLNIDMGKIIYDLNIVLEQIVLGIIKSLRLEQYMSKEEINQFNKMFISSIQTINKSIKK